MISHLFVYGTLKSVARSDYGREAQRRLHSEAELVGPASVGGRLLNLGQYPGLIEPASANERVKGEILRLYTPLPTFVWLDRYEGIRSSETAAIDDEAQYVRVVRPAMLANGDLLDAWLYLFAGDPRPFSPVSGGTWPATEPS